MPYVLRDAATDKVIALTLAEPAPGAELLPATHPEVMAFLFSDPADASQAAQFLAADLGFIRVMEDVIEALMDKHVLSVTDLPEPAQDKLTRRKGLRSYLAGVAPLGEDEAKVI